MHMRAHACAHHHSPGALNAQSTITSALCSSALASLSVVTLLMRSSESLAGSCTHTHTHKHTNGHAHSQRMFGSSVIDSQPMVSRDGDEIAHRQPAHMDFNFAQVKKEQRKEKAKLPRRQFPSEVLF